MGSVTKKEEEIREDEEEAQAEVEIWKYLFGFTNMAVVKCAIELGIADAIENNECPDDTIRVILLAWMRSFLSLPHHETALSRRLLKKGEKSMADLLLFESSHVMLAPWHNLSSRVLKDKSSPFEGAHGDDVWKYASKNPVHSKLLDDAMACDARLVVPEIVEGCPEWVLHDWNDEECIKILENCKEAIQSDNGKLIIVEAVVGEEKGDKHEFVRLTLDMIMMSHTTAGQRKDLQGMGIRS
ncbi:3'-HYDROXY-N-METHYL-(S)-COCLAURINE 4'-O-METHYLTRANSFERASE 2-LIKE [Salix purpurea]|uniref:3'-HYDROXY-N-METHYL-(S)-COCLAURINE 4'-O-METHYLTRANSFERASE 2-LIKE n=1 Tax=Salix purpurea TaxID=77065 RepID=A0A9Q0PR76_SALPP|nr:3'-HYDROXY-N-METHYL-(S)-COCLAURINE 4'-O-METHYLTRANSFERASE 2-LIKE [Salix purpurea]